MESLAVILICLTSSYVLSELCRRIGLPKIIGPLLIGLLFGSTALRDYLFDSNSLEIITLLKELCVIFMLFYVGLKIDLKQFIRSSKLSISVGFFASFLSLLLGYLLVLFLNETGLLRGLIPPGVSVHIVGIVVGICLSVTAEAVSIDILQEFNLLTSKVGETIIEAGIVDDVIGIFLISGLVTFIESSANPGIGMLSLFLEIVLFAIIIYGIGIFLVPRIMKFVGNRHSRVDFFAVALIIALFMAVVSLNLGLSSIIGALAGGVVIRQALLAGSSYERKEEKDITSMIEIMTFGLLAPFFFIWIGFNTDISILFTHPFLVLFIVIIAFMGKILGSIIGAGVVRESAEEGEMIGWGMNIRGAVGFIVALLILEKGLISNELFSAIIFMSFATTVISPIMFKILVKNYHNIEDLEERKTN